VREALFELYGMKFLVYIYYFSLFVFISIPIAAQQLKANVVQEVGCLPVMVPVFENMEQLAHQWQIPQHLLEKVNKALNGRTGESVLVNMPLTDKLITSACEGCLPVVHQVQKGEGLYRIGLWYGNISSSVLKKMNRLRSDALQPGQEMVVGYLPDTLMAALQNGRRETFAQSEEVTGLKDSVLIGKVPPTMKEPERAVLIYEGEGVFRAEYKQGEERVDRKKMKTATFKSESGWEDGRFYLLSNQIRSGVVVKITNPFNGAYLYAKVVGPMPDMKQNAGLQLRLSNAAAIKLGFNSEDEVHELDLSY
jgi:hypothetical protein